MHDGKAHIVYPNAKFIMENVSCGCENKDIATQTIDGEDGKDMIYGYYSYSIHKAIYIRPLIYQIF